MTSLIKQFNFELWSNSLVLQSLRSMKSTDERALLLFSHLLSSHSMWLSRVNKTEFTCTLFQERSLDECEKLMNENHTAWIEFLTNKTYEELQQKIEFMGAWEAVPRKRRMSIEDALIHLINHSSYHRGQIVARMKGHINELPLSTYIMYAAEIID